MKIVLIGAPCSGKSMVIKELKKRGYEVISETAREVISARKAIPITRDENLIRQHLMLETQIEKEKYIDNNRTYFLDRGHVDNGAFCRYLLKEIPERIEKEMRRNRYDSVFFLEKLPLIKDNERKENENERIKIEDFLIKTYTDYGYSPIFIPVMNIIERADKITHNYNKRGENYGMHK